MSFFRNKVVWITGASSGIGEALTYAFHQRGANVIISSRRREALDQVKANCEGNTDNIHVLPLDLSDPQSLPGKAEEALALYGHVDYLFNNGGISQRSTAVETQLDVTRRVLEINFFGQVALTKAILPVMMERKNGHIIVTSSVTGKFGTRLRSSYAASKHALHGYYDCLRQEVQDHNIKVTLVCPGYIKTNVTINAVEGDGSRHGKMGKGQEHGMAASEFAEKLIAKVEQGKEEVYIGGKEILAIYLKRLSPALLYRVLSRTEVT